MSFRTWTWVVLSAALAAQPAAAQTSHDDHHGHEASLGHVQFDTTCSETAKPEFARAVALLHSFEYAGARDAFTRAADLDAACGMAHWGVAMTYYHPLWAPPTETELAAGRKAAETAERLGAKSDRERQYIAAIGAFYIEPAPREPRARAAAYSAAMEKLASTHKDDDEAQIFLALSLLGTAPPNDATFANQKRAAKLVEPLIAKNPQHPGVLHYTIHAFDAPELASLALPAARVYAKVAPASPHALHMPSHIFTRLGLWDESIRSNTDSASAGRAIVAKSHPGRDSYEALHALDYLEYAYLQLGDDERARKVLEEIRAVTQLDEPTFSAGYALAAVPARYALERRDWGTATALELPTQQLPWERFSYVRGVTYFANAIGAARSGNLSRARRAVDALRELQSTLASAPPGGPYDWAGQVESMRLAGAGWLAHAEGTDDEAVRLLTAAAEKEELVGKHPVTPGAILPARELLGDLLVELRRPAEAVVAYEQSLKQAPRRLNTLAGAAHAAKLAGDSARSRKYSEELRALCGDSCSRVRREEPRTAD
jgi:tetratricopeptide (TPR) repeat protein